MTDRSLPPVDLTPYIPKPDRDTIDAVVAMFGRDGERRCVRIYLQWLVWDRDTERIRVQFAGVARSTIGYYLSKRGPLLMERFRRRLPPEIVTNSRIKRSPILLELTMRAAATLTKPGDEPKPLPRPTGRPRTDPEWMPRTLPPSAIRAWKARAKIAVGSKPGKNRERKGIDLTSAQGRPEAIRAKSAARQVPRSLPLHSSSPASSTPSLPAALPSPAGA